MRVGLSWAEVVEAQTEAVMSYTQQHGGIQRMFSAVVHLCVLHFYPLITL